MTDGVMTGCPPVLWHDEALLVVNKPAGVLVIPGGFDRSTPLSEVLRVHFGPIWVVHRLDRDTSGVLAFARTAAAHRALNTQFQERRVTKVYHALIGGEPPWETRTVALPLRPNGDRRHRTVVDRERGRASRTRLRVLERFGSHALVAAMPESGRRHQIRAHLAALGFPVVADILYGARDADTIPPLRRVALHAFSLSLRHPVTGVAMTFEAPYPADLRAALRHLRSVGCP